MVALNKLKDKVGTGGRLPQEKMDLKIRRVKELISKGLSTTRACYTVGIWVGQYKRWTGGKVKPAKKTAAKKPAKKAPAKKDKRKRVTHPGQ